LKVKLIMIKYTKLTKEQFNEFIQDEVFRNLYNSYEKIKRKLEKRKQHLIKR
jgi:hypothetical protein